MNECCKTVTTPFCPRCGSAVISHDILGLLKHVQNTRNSLKYRLDDIENYYKGYKPEYIERRRKGAEKCLGKWDTWHTALLSLLEERDANG